MTSIRAVLRKLLRQASGTDERISASELSYTVYWTTLARNWSPERRLHVRSLVQQIVSRPDFVPNEFERRYSIADVDDLEHAGASLVALEKVLTSFIEGVVEEE